MVAESKILAFVPVDSFAREISLYRFPDIPPEEFAYHYRNRSFDREG